MRALAIAALFALATTSSASAAQTRGEKVASWRLGRAVRVAAGKMLDVAHGEKPYTNLPGWSHPSGLSMQVVWTGGKQAHVELTGAGHRAAKVPVPGLDAGGSRGFFLRGNKIGGALRAAAPGLTSKGFRAADRSWNQAVNAPR